MNHKQHFKDIHRIYDPGYVYFATFKVARITREMVLFKATGG